MLVRELKRGDTLKIGDVVINVLATGNGRVRLGVEAPIEIPIVHKKKQPTVADNHTTGVV